jgi:hypothetical protein
VSPADPKPWGLLFKAPMALAVRREVDPKTVTRRIEDRWAKCGAGRVLWVKEVWQVVRPLLDGDYVEGVDIWPGRLDRPPVDPWLVWYSADSGDADLHPDDRTVRRWRSPLLMPRWASRTTLRTVSVTREEWTPETRLPEDEARREGFATADEFHALWSAMHPAYTGPVWRVEVTRG